MPLIQILQNGQKVTVTKQQVFELAKQGKLKADSPIWVNGKEIICGRIQGIVFGVEVPMPPVQFNTSEPSSPQKPDFQSMISLNSKKPRFLNLSFKYFIWKPALVILWWAFLVFVVIFIPFAISQYNAFKTIYRENIKKQGAERYVVWYESSQFGSPEKDTSSTPKSPDMIALDNEVKDTYVASKKMLENRQDYYDRLCNLMCIRMIGSQTCVAFCLLCFLSVLTVIVRIVCELIYLHLVYCTGQKE